ncbi:hypothetical protein HAP41_0000047330 (plasmid) [Bradyrhizobium barranii subsp. apii]|uniref:Uncharacterized protein n=1 Tax=Bradyrhizobium barranii subsp. apii TaxID=2819348 RepID=A0A8T5VSU9_9BRAD|nr:hypothetical protein [Bradyrhizobium barranii]UPT92342.1 hypothetical protein HAP41_0000047330 [Bradyrhizobium barranii subsp. apii]
MFDAIDFTLPVFALPPHLLRPSSSSTFSRPPLEAGALYAAGGLGTEIIDHFNL